MFHRVNSIPYSGGSSNSQFQLVHFFISRSSKLSSSWRSILSLQGFNLILFILHFVWSFFYYRSSSWRLYMVVRQGFLSFFICSSRLLSRWWSAKLHSKINMVPNTCFVLWYSSILHLAFQSAILSILSFEVVLYHSWQFLFMFRDSHVVKNEVF